MHSKPLTSFSLIFLREHVENHGGVDLFIVLLTRKRIRVCQIIPFKLIMKSDHVPEKSGAFLWINLILPFSKSKSSYSASFSISSPTTHPHLSSLLLTFLLVVAQQRWMPALEESSVMGRRAKLLKPRSWGAADIRLFSISPSVFLSPCTVFYPHFMVPYSVCLPLYHQSVLLLTPAPVLLAVLFILILFLFCSLLSTFCFL